MRPRLRFSGSNGPAREGLPEEHEADHRRGEVALHVAGNRTPGRRIAAKLTQSTVGESHFRKS